MKKLPPHAFMTLSALKKPWSSETVSPYGLSIMDREWSMLPSHLYERGE